MKKPLKTAVVILSLVALLIFVLPHRTRTWLWWGFWNENRVTYQQPANQRLFEIRRKTTHNLESYTEIVTFSPNSGQMAVGCVLDRRIFIYDVPSGALLRALEQKKGDPEMIAYSPDGKYLVSGFGWKSAIYVWNTVTGELLRTITAADDRLRASSYFTISPDSQFMVVSCLPRERNRGEPPMPPVRPRQDTHVYEIETGKVIAIYSTPYGHHGPFALNHAGTLLYYGQLCQKGPDYPRRYIPHGCIEVMDLTSGNIVQTIEDNPPANGFVKALRTSPDGRHIASAGDDAIIRIHDLSTGRLVRAIKGHTARITTIAYSADGKYLLSGSQDNSIRMWQTETGQAVISITTIESPKSVAFSNDGRYFAATAGKAVTVWEIVKKN